MIEAMNANRPNIILLTTDQHSWSAVSAHGNPYVQTPNIDRMVAGGMSFERMYATDPVCTPQRSTWMTGRYSSETGAPFNGGEVREELPNLGGVLRACGYETFHAGKWHLPGVEVEQFFNVLYYGQRRIGASGGEIFDSVIADAVVEFLERPATESPFYLQCHFVNPHDICEYLHNFEHTSIPNLVDLGVMSSDELPPLPDNFDYDDSETVLHRAARRVEGSFIHDDIRRAVAEWSETDWRAYIWHYYRFVEEVDRQLGRVLDALEASDHHESTVILFTSDHGEACGSHRMFQKFTLYDESLRVPMVLSGAGIERHSDRSTRLVSGIDVFRTICDLAAADPPTNTHGRSLRQVVKILSRPDEWVYVESNYFGRAIVDQRFKYVTEYIPNTRPELPPNAQRNRRGREQLFDLVADPGETKNLADLDGYTAVLERMQQRLSEFESQLDQRELQSESAREIARNWAARVLDLWQKEEDWNANFRSI